MNIPEIEGHVRTMGFLSDHFGYYVSPSDKTSLRWSLDMIKEEVFNGSNNVNNNNGLIKQEVVEDILKAVAEMRSAVGVITQRFGSDKSEKTQFFASMKKLELSIARATAESKGIQTEKSWIVEEKPLVEGVKALSLEDLTGGES